ncbi:MAG: HEAT repeat domain-containing protein, partial [Prevotella sp.]|nr:HEAT repeat domain-containing protein [Prevotella sp.]
MRNKLLVLMLCATATAMTASAQRIIKPKVKAPTSFAIVIDQKSYDKVSAAVEAYKESIEADGLATYLLIDDWKNPEAIKEQLKKLYTDKKSPLEGCVFVGDIPIPMVRDAQHLTSAFKMNQSRDWKESSVASDRYYDDFDLTFDFLKQDADIPLYFYYSLRPDSRHTLTPDIYSGRIKPVEIAGTDKYVLLERYLKKVVREKKENSDNVLDHLSMGRGHGYNSQDRVAWA